VKAIVCAREIMTERLVDLLAQQGVDVMTVTNMSQVASVMQGGNVELVVLDPLAIEAEALSSCLRAVSAGPVVIALSNRQTDWERLQSLAIDGYLPEEAGNAEVLARMRAVIRRHLPGLGTASNEQLSLAQ